MNPDDGTRPEYGGLSTGPYSVDARASLQGCPSARVRPIGSHASARMPRGRCPGMGDRGGLATYAHGYGRDRQASRWTRAHDPQLRVSEGRQHVTYAHG